jgi:hypothetical protein
MFSPPLSPIESPNLGPRHDDLPDIPSLDSIDSRLDRTSISWDQKFKSGTSESREEWLSAGRGRTGLRIVIVTGESTLIYKAGAHVIQRTSFPRWMESHVHLPDFWNTSRRKVTAACFSDQVPEWQVSLTDAISAANICRATTRLILWLVRSDFL